MNVFLRHILLYIYYSATLIFQIPEAKKTPTSKQQDPGEQLAMAFLNSPDSDDDVNCNGDCNDEDVGWWFFEIPFFLIEVEWKKLSNQKHY